MKRLVEVRGGGDVRAPTATSGWWLGASRSPVVKDLSSWCEPACEMTPWGERTLNLTKPADDLARLKRSPHKHR